MTHKEIQPFKNGEVSSSDGDDFFDKLGLQGVVGGAELGDFGAEAAEFGGGEEDSGFLSGEFRVVL
jgi:hypothetical protein